MKKIFLSSLLAGAVGITSLFANSPAQLKAVPDGDLAKIRQAVPERAAATPAKPRKVLVMWLCKGYYHESIPWVNAAIQALGDETGAYQTEFTNDPADFTDSNLKQYDAIIFNSTTHLDKTGNEAMRKAIAQYAHNGGGVVGIHAATDNFYKWPEVAELMGGAFDGHPWNAKGTWRVENADPMHPMNRVFDGCSFDINDELYQMKDPYNRTKQRVILTVDAQSPVNTKVKGKKRKDNDFGLSWVRQFGKGRLYYSGFGHNKHVAWDARILKTWLDGIQFAVGDLNIPTDPIAIADAATLFLALRDGNFGLMGKRDLCRRLEPLVEPQHMAAFGPMLLDTDISHYVRKIVENTPCVESETVLIQALAKAPDALNPGIVSSLGALKSEASVAAIAQYMGETDMTGIRAAMRALGNIGNAEALAALTGVQSELPALEKERTFAVIECAYALLAAGQVAEAEAVFDQMIQSEFAHIQIAAYQGLVSARSETASKVIAHMNSSDDPRIQQAGAVLIADLPKAALNDFVARLGSFSEPVQLTILDTVKAKGGHSSAAVVATLLDAPSAALQIAAIQTLGAVGDASYTEKLLDKAGESRDMEKAVVQSISSLKDPEVDQILRGIVQQQSAHTLLAVECLSQRQANLETFKVLLGCLTAEDTSLARKAGNALISQTQFSDLPALVAVVKSAPDSFASKVLVKILSDNTYPNAAEAVEVTEQAIAALQQSSQQASVTKTLVRYPLPKTKALLNQLQQNAALAKVAADTLQSIEISLTQPPTLESSHGKERLKNLYNRNPKDRWTTDAFMKPGMWLQINLAAPMSIDTIALDNSGGSQNDFPRSYEVYISDDGQSWGSPVLKGKGANPVTLIKLDGRTTSHVKIVCTDQQNKLYWSVHDLKINNISLAK
ncbi:MULTISPECIES: ThuA domain-containing protein [unclassified Lentimonas]|uniref:ThuA domain-containing protein n=1 Tax=unclassified Lentimonas TaxID=2630993 RepID=UPI0013898BF9|nr:MULTISPECIES: ThuA domain-containing protein [unclassified Lentimonas]